MWRPLWPTPEAGCQMMPSIASARFHSTGSAEEVEVLRRFVTSFGAGHVLTLLADLLVQEADYCLLSGEPAKAAALARRAKALTRAAEAIRE